WGSGNGDFAILQNILPRWGSGNGDFAILQNILPRWGSGNGDFAILQTSCPAGAAEMATSLFFLQTSCPAGAAEMATSLFYIHPAPLGQRKWRLRYSTYILPRWGSGNGDFAILHTS